jgi:hypothetical protein
MSFTQLPNDPAPLVKPHSASAALGRYKEDANMGVCGGEGQIQMPFYR